MSRPRSRPLLVLLLAFAMTVLGVGPATARDVFVEHDTRHWTWEAPQSWRTVSKTESTLWVEGRSEPSGAYADVEWVTRDIECEAGDSWSVRVRRFFWHYRQSLRSRGWTIQKTSRIFHPKGTPPAQRRQRLKIRAGDRGIEVADYGFVGRRDGVLVCHEDIRYREIGPGHTRRGIRRIARVLSSIEHK